ncbi:hypothetical protein [Catenulispora rubra]|nr:hypothetical protein [Catenulispora rubra]
MAIRKSLEESVVFDGPSVYWGAFRSPGRKIIEEFKAALTQLPR